MREPGGEWSVHPWVAGGGGRVRVGVQVTPIAPLTDWATALRLARTARLFAARHAWTPAHMVAYYEPLLRAGIQYSIVVLNRYDDLETLELLAEHVVPELRGPLWSS